MALKTFNINEETYKKYSEYCKKEGISMSKRIENFIQEELHNLKPEKQSSKTQKQEHKHKSEPTFQKYC